MKFKVIKRFSSYGPVIVTWLLIHGCQASDSSEPSLCPSGTTYGKESGERLCRNTISGKEKDGVLSHADREEVDRSDHRSDSSSDKRKTIWRISFGGGDQEKLSGFELGPDGNIYVSGSFRSNSIQFGESSLENMGGWDCYLAKIDSEGNHVWSKAIGGSKDDQCYDIAVGPEGSVSITGSYKGANVSVGGNSLDATTDLDVFVARFSKRGSHVWFKAFGGNGVDRGWSVGARKRGSVTLGASLKSESGGENGFLENEISEVDSLLLNISREGTVEWKREINGRIHGPFIKVTETGSLLLHGKLESDGVNFGNGKVEQLKPQADNGILLAKFGNEGDFRWSDSIGGTGNEFSTALAVEEGKTFVAGSFSSISLKFAGTTLVNQGKADALLLSYTSNGERDWAQIWGGKEVDILNGVDVTDYGLDIVGEFRSSELIVGDRTLSNNGGYNNGFATRLGEDSKVKSSIHFSSIGNTPQAVAVHEGLRIVAGTFRDVWRFGEGEKIQSEGNEDVYLIGSKY